MKVKTRFSRFVTLILIFFSATIPDALAQISSNVRTEFFVQPFPSPYVSDWQTNPSIASLTVFNGSNIPKEAVIALSVTTNDGRQVISGTSSPTVLLHGSTVLNNTSLLHGNLKYYDTGIKNQIIQTGRIPEGTYTACIRITGAEGIQLATEECRDFTIVYPDPPQLVYPMDGDSVSTGLPIFQWTPVQVPVQYSIHYVVKIVQLLSGQTPLQALQADIPQYTNNNVAGTTLQYPLSALQLVAGDTYVWQVQALDQNGFPPASNNGESQIWTFTYQKPVGIVTYHHVNPVGPGTPPVNNNLFTATTITGNISGTFTLPQSARFVVHHGRFGYSGSSGSSAQPAVQPTPLANVTLNLVAKYMLVKFNPVTRTTVEKSVPRRVLPSDPKYDDADQVVATTTTDPAGNFSFSFLQTDSTGTIAQNQTITFQGGEFSDIETGTLTKVYRLIVDNPYYCSPDNDITVRSGQTANVGQQYALVRSYSLNITLMPNSFSGTQQITTEPLQGMPVYLLRQNRPQGVPDNEGLPTPTSSQPVQDMQVVAEATSDANGQVTFSDLVQNIGPNDQYFIYAAPDPKSSLFYTTLPTSFQFSYQQSPSQYPGYQVSPNTWRAPAIFNSDYVTPTVSVNQMMWAAKPRVAGAIYRADNPDVPVASADVSLAYSTPSGWSGPLGSTAEDGSFHLYPELGVPGYELTINKYGYMGTILQVNNGAPLKMGQQVYFDKILLQPFFNVTGKVVDGQGNPVEAHVTIGQGASVVANQPTYLWKAVWNGRAIVNEKYQITPNTGFQSPAVPGYQQIIIDPTPYDNSFFPDTENVNITQKGQDLGTFVVKKKLHRIQVAVSGVGKAGIINLAQAHVNIVNVGNFETDNSGIVETKFVNESDRYTIVVTAPDGKDFVGQTMSANVPESKDWTVIPVTLKRAAYITGRVLVGNTPIPGADVYLDQRQSQNMPPVRTRTNNNGIYVLHNVPLRRPIRIEAAKSQSNYVGADTTLVLNLSGARNVNFQLTVYNGMDITKLMGFPIEVNALDTTSGVKISGNIVSLPSNKVFAASSSSLTIPFHDISIVPGAQKNSTGVPFAVPKTLPLVTDANSIPLKIYGALVGAQENSKGISIADAGNGTGEFMGPTCIKAASFKGDPAFSSVAFPNNRFYLGLPGESNQSKKLLVPVITSSGGTPPEIQNGFDVSDDRGNSMHYTFYGFDAVADSSKSFVNGDTVRLATTIHSDLAYVPQPDINLDIGDVTLHSTKLDPIMSNNTIRIALEKWTIEGDQWSISQEGGLTIDKGEVNTGTVAVPFTALQITPTALQSGNFKTNSISLSGILPLTITGNWSFGYDSGKQHWSLFVAPKNGNTNSAAYVANLPGAYATDKLSINNFYLLSNGTEGFTMDNTATPLTLYEVASFQPTGLDVSQSSVNVSGTMDIGVPSVKSQSCVINYTRPSGVLTFNLEKFGFGWNTCGVNLEFANQNQSESLDSRGFRAEGTASEKGAFNFNVNLYRTVDSTSIWTAAGQSFNISQNGAASLTNVVGFMEANGNSWGCFSFTGDFAGKGASGNLGLVANDGLSGNNQTMNIQDSTPLGGIMLWYDPSTGSLYGHVHANDSANGIASFSGDLALSIDATGWYFFGGVIFGAKSDVTLQLELALLIGDHPMVDSLQSLVEEYSYYYSKTKTLPQTFPTTLSGFYFEGDGKVPLPFPLSASCKLGVVNGGWSLSLGGDFSCSMTFGNSPSSGSGFEGYYLYGDATVYVNADVVIACAGAKAEATLILGGSTSLPVPPSWDWEAYPTIQLPVKAYVYYGTGACWPQCNQTGCIAHGDTAQATLNLDGWFGTDSSGVKFTATGKASGS